MAAKTIKKPTKKPSPEKNKKTVGTGKKIVKIAVKNVKKAVKKAVKKVVKKAVKKPAIKANKKTVDKPNKVTLMPAVGSMAPDFALPSDTSGIVSLEDFRGKNIVLYFYPKNDTPGCTREACSFQENKKQISQQNAVVIGVSPDGVSRHEKFRKKYGLDFILVADEEKILANLYGVWVEKNNYGKKYMGVQRATFLIDKTGRVAYVWPKVSVDGHTEEVLRELNSLN